METENKKNYESLKKWAPVAVIVLLTAILMVYFKVSNIDYISIQNVGRDIVAEYTKNLKPVFSRTKLTKEDLVNFAFYENLPLDKQNNTVLQIKSDKAGNEKFFVRPAAINPKTNNYERFVKKLKLTKDEIAVFDSILNVYNESLYKSVLYNDNNTLAVNPNLPILQKAMSTDIYQFLKQRVYEKNKIELPDNYATLNRDKIHSVIEKNQRMPAKDFIFITPDTVFQYEYKTGIEDYMAALSEPDNKAEASGDTIQDAGSGDEAAVKISTPIINLENENLASNYAHYNIDSNYYFAEIPDNFYTIEGLPDYDSFKVSLDNLAIELNSISLNIDFDKDGKLNLDLADFTNEDSLRTFNLEFNLKNLTSFISEAIDAAGKYDESDWEKFGLKMDSLAKSMEFMKVDSLKLIKIKERADSIGQSAKRLERSR